MKLVRFAKRSQIGGGVIEAGTETLIDDDVPLSAHMTLVSGGSAADEPPAPQAAISKAGAMARAAAQELTTRQEQERKARMAAAAESARITEEARARVLAKAQAAAQKVLDVYEKSAAERAEALEAKRAAANKATTDAIDAALAEALQSVADIFDRHEPEIARHATEFAAAQTQAQVDEARIQANADADAQIEAQALVGRFQQALSTGSDPDAAAAKAGA